MTDYRDYFIYLIRCFLNGKKPSGKSVEWDKLFKLADLHELGGVIAREIELLDDEFKPDSKFASYFNQRLGYAVQHAAVKEEVLKILDDFLSSNAFEHYFVKWAIVKDYYPFSELRTSGDIDVIVKESDFEKIVSLAKESFKVLSYVSTTLIVEIDGVKVEIHKDADVETPYFDSAFEKGCLDLYEHMLYVLCHLKKHLSYTGAGIRMLMDLDVLARAIPNFSESRFLELAGEVGAEKTAETLLSLSNLWFDTPVTQTVDIPEELLDNFKTVFLDGGSFGYNLSTVPARYLSYGSGFKALLKMAFPSREYLKTAYPYYEKNGLLLPVARVNRLADGLFKKRKRAKNAFSQLAFDNKTSAQLELMKELNINPKE